MEDPNSSSASGPLLSYEKHTAFKFEKEKERAEKGHGEEEHAVNGGDVLKESVEEVVDDGESQELRIVRTILGIEGSESSTEVFQMLHEWIISSSNLSRTAEMEDSLDMFYIFFHLLRKCSPAKHVEELKRLIKYVESWTIIKIYCSRHRWVKKIVEEVIPFYLKWDPPDEADPILVELIVLVEILGSFSIHESELKSIFLLLQSSAEQKTRTWSLLLDALRKMSSVAETPGVFFNFSGNPDYGLVIPAIKKWPAGGYGFCTWIRVESFHHPNIPNYRPHVFSFLTGDGSGIELFFTEGSMLCLHINVKGKKSTQKLQFSFHPKKWYFVCISHEYHFLGRSNLKFYVDFKHKWEFPVVYPKITEPLTSCYIGMNSQSLGSAVGKSHPLFGQMGSFFFFNESLQHNEIKYLAEMPATFFSNYQPHLGSGPLDSKIASKVMFAYSPKASNSSGCFNIIQSSPTSKEIVDGIFQGISVVKITDIKEAILYIGGIKAIFPLFSQFMNSESKKPQNKNEGKDDDLDEKVEQEIVPSGIDPTLSSQMFYLLTGLLKGAENQADFLECNGFQVLGYILGDLPPNFFITETIVALNELANAVSSNDRLLKELFLSVLLDFRLWIYTSVLVQKDLIHLISTYALDKPQWFHHDIGIQRILDICRTYYWFVPEDDASMALESSITDPTTGYVVGLRPSSKKIRELRRSLLDVVFNFTKEFISFEETKSILMYLLDCRDNKQIVDLLQVFLSLQQHTKHPVVKHLVNLGGIDPFIGLLKSNYEHTRIWSLKVIGKILENSPAKQKDQLITHHKTTVIKKYLQQFPMTQATYFSLMELLLECVDITSIRHPIRSRKPTDVQNFKNPGIISTVFELVCLTGNTDLQQRALEDSQFLLKYSNINRTIFLEQHWQSWLFGLLANYSTQSALNLTGKARKEVYALILDLFAMLHHQSLTQADGWTTMIQTEILLEYFSERGFFHEKELKRALNMKLFQALRNDANIMETKDLRLWTVLARWVQSMEEFLFYSDDQHSRQFDYLTVELDSTGQWAYFHLAQQFSDYVDVLMERFNQVVNSLSSPSQAQKINECFIRVQLNIGTVTIQEAEQFGSKEKMIEHNSHFEKLQSIMAQKKPRMRDSTIQYVKAKLAEHTSAVSELERLIVKNLKRMEDITTKYLAGEVNDKRLLYLLASLYKLMKASHEQSGLAKEFILTTFKSLLPKLVLPEELQGMDEDQLVAHFMSGFSFPDQPFTVGPEIESAMIQILEEQKKLGQAKSIRVSQNSQTVLETIQKEMLEESSTSAKFTQNFKKMSESFCNQEKARRDDQDSSLYQQIKLAGSKWKKMNRVLSSERGPWGNVQNQTVFWKLDKVETPSRLRKRIKRNFEGVDHKNLTVEALRHKAAEKSSALLQALSGREDKSEEEIVEMSEESNVANIPLNSIILELECELVKPMRVAKGVMQLSPSHLYFIDAQCGLKKQWKLDQVVKIYGRRYLLCWTAFEMFMYNRTNFFFNFTCKRDVEKAFKKLVSLSPSVKDSHLGSPGKYLKKVPITQLWQQRKMSNFDYLMLLNTVAGRTYNDLAQYPIFPWILKDYTSSTIDLNDPKVYRDLSKPIGALNPQRLQQYQERLEGFQDASIPPFLYGSHYSSIGITLFYLIRLEPFCSHFLTMQGGYFDIPERMFGSIPSVWENCMNGTADVKELIPEFFYLPEFLENVNGVDLGTKQDGKKITDVVLPPWARGDPKKFIRINAQALESEYVSEHLHEWIDLIFGFKQNGLEALKAHNVFYHLSYEGGVNLESIVDPTEKKSTIDQIQNFGQTPPQLFSKEHPKRLPATDHLPAISPPSKMVTGGQSPYCYILKPRTFAASELPIIFIRQFVDQIITVYRDGIVAISKWSNVPDGRGCPFTFEVDKTLASQKPRDIQVLLPVDKSSLSSCFALSHDGKMIYHSGFWDNSLKQSMLSNGQTIFIAYDHGDTITCLDIGDDGSTIVTGSLDSSVRVWWDSSLEDSKKKWTLPSIMKHQAPPIVKKHILVGHDAEVTCISVSTDLGIVASGSLDKTVLLYSLHGKYIRTLHHPSAVDLVKVVDQGSVVTYCTELSTLFLYDINGKLENTATNVKSITHILITRDGNLLVTGDANGSVCVRSLLTLEIKHTFESANSRIRSLAFVSEQGHEKYIMAGLQVGNLVIFKFNPSSW